MQIKSLTDVPVEIVHQAFVDAFSDYEIQIQMPLEKFLEMMQTRSLNLAYSIGCFDGEQLVGFIICGYREYGGEKYCYDGGTGTIKEYRRKGIGGELLQNLIVDFKARGFDWFLLEVLENNKAAIELYEKNGFAKTRLFRCYLGQKKEIRAWGDHHYRVDSDIRDYLKLDHSIYLPFHSSWQNDKQSIENVLEKYAYVSVVEDDQVLAYGLIHRTRGDIPQIGVLKECREKGMEEILLHELMQRTESERLAFLNVEDGNYLGRKLTEMRFNNFNNQYEMKLRLKG